MVAPFYLSLDNNFVKMWQFLWKCMRVKWFKAKMSLPFHALNIIIDSAGILSADKQKLYYNDNVVYKKSDWECSINLPT